MTSTPASTRRARSATTASRRRRRARSIRRNGRTAPPSNGAVGSRAASKRAGPPPATPSPARSSAHLVWYVRDLELDAVGVVEEDGVVALAVPVILGPALDRHALAAQPLGALVDLLARIDLEADVMDADPVAVVGNGVRVRLLLAEPDRRPLAPDVVDR